MTITIVTCRRCLHEFCWICLQDYIGHNSFLCAPTCNKCKRRHTYNDKKVSCTLLSIKRSNSVYYGPIKPIRFVTKSTTILLTASLITVVTVPYKVYETCNIIDISDNIRAYKLERKRSKARRESAKRHSETAKRGYLYPQHCYHVGCYQLFYDLQSYGAHLVSSHDRLLSANDTIRNDCKVSVSQGNLCSCTIFIERSNNIINISTGDACSNCNHPRECHY